MLYMAVNFHYIHDADKYPFEGIYAVPEEKLKSQIEEIGSHFEFVGMERILEEVESGGKLPDRCCTITFDDGLRCQYENALPVLEAAGVPAIFFVNAIPYSEKKPCLVHMIHYLRATMGSDRFFELMMDGYEKETGSPFRIEDYDSAAAKNQYRYDTGKMALLKFILNNAMDFDLRNRIVSAIFEAEGPDAVAFCRDFYMSEEQVRDLEARNCLGLHSYAHEPMSRKSLNEMRKDVAENMRVIGDIAGADSFAAYSYPYGSQEAVSNEVALLLKGFGFKFAFTMERAFNECIAEPLLLSRFDTNDVIGGKKPIFKADGGVLESVCGAPLPVSRGDFCKDAGASV